MSSTIKLGNKVRDIVTGFQGIATVKAEYLTGCVQFGVTPDVSTDGKIPDTVWFDDKRLEFVAKGIAVEVKRTGGTQRDVPPSSPRH